MDLSKLSLILILAYAYFVNIFVLYLKKPAFGAAYLLLIVSVLFFVEKINKIPKKWTIESKLTLICIALMGLSVLLQRIVFYDRVDVFGISAHEYLRSVYMMISFWFFSGAAISKLRMEKNQAISVLLMLPFCILVYPFLNEYYLISYENLARDGFIGVNHLLIAEMILLVGFLSYSLAEGDLRWIVILITVALMYACGGRTSLYLGSIVFGVFQYVMGGKKDRIFLISVLMLIIFAISFMQTLEVDIGVGRMFLTSGFLTDESWIEREALLESGLSGLMDQVLIGNVSKLVEINGGVGTFIHNVISAWQFFGFYCFILILIIVYQVCRKVYLVMSEVACLSVADIFGLLCLSYGILGVIVSKYIGFSFLWFSLGFWVWRLQYKKQTLQLSR